jgi:hypothetical protein
MKQDRDQWLGSILKIDEPLTWSKIIISFWALSKLRHKTRLNASINVSQGGITPTVVVTQKR